MNNLNVQMNYMSTKLGYWSAFLCVVTFVLWIICFLGILIVNPLFTWTNLPNFIAYSKENTQYFKYLADLSMIIFGLSFVVLLNSVYDYTHENKKTLARISIFFSVIFAALINVNYFVQLSTVRLSILKGQINGIEQFIQSYPISGIAAINMLGWSLFLGLSSLFIAPVFSGSKLEKVIKYSFFVNGIICILGGTAYVLDIVVLVFLFMNLGLGASLLVATISLYMLFKRIEKRHIDKR